MFVEAIEKAGKYTRPIFAISRNYGSTQVIPGASTLFFINSDGWALTCGHVVDILVAAEQINKNYQSFKTELASQQNVKKNKSILHGVEKKYQFNKNITIELQLQFVNCIEGYLEINFFKHPKHDLALLKFNNFNKLLCDSFPYFPKDTTRLKQGIFLCRLGFPFPEFSNFAYETETDKIIWTNTGRKDSPIFPIEGMLTRHLLDKDGHVFGFEMSTPGLRGQSGGPVFDTDGKVWGMQFSTRHLDLDFDVNQEVLRNGLTKRVQDSAFLHVGNCIHVEIMKSFMRELNVEFQEE